ncbi:MAG: hypothetical protein JM58_09155 [Peptococcaceae bacterium BICA1-8]|nr:MAG: hypothetical protein JM58_09155 [Peptococcaceae bacterium BICA1-8]
MIGSLNRMIARVNTLVIKANNIEWSDEFIISEIQRLSIDGYCPKPDDNRNLYQAAYRRKGLRHYCEQAGVRTHRAPAKPREKAKARQPEPSRTSTERLKLFVAVISMAWETEQKVDITNCLEAVRRGDADHFKII